MQTNVELENKVLNELRKEPLLEKTQLTIKALRGVVTLTGKAESREIKIAAKTVARRVPGVKSVIERLEIKPPDTEDTFYQLNSYM